MAMGRARPSSVYYAGKRRVEKGGAKRSEFARAAATNLHVGEPEAPRSIVSTTRNRALPLAIHS